MNSYPTLDYLTDLTSSEMAAARPLAFKPYQFSGSGWDYQAQVVGDESYALLHDTYKFTAKKGATYDIFSVSYFDPFLLRVYDYLGNTIVANNEADDGPDMELSGVYYSNDTIFDWVAPYTGTYYVAANWNQGNYYKFYGLSIYEDIDTAISVDTIAPTIAISSNAFNLTWGETAVITFTLSESSTNFVAADVSVSGGALSKFVGSGTSYSAIFTPAANSTAPGVISVASGKFTDSANNANVDGADFNNTVAMTVTAWAQLNGTLGNDTIVSTVRNEHINGLTGIDKIVYDGSVGEYSLSIHRATKTATITDSRSGRDGQDSLNSVEKAQFGTQTFDLFNPARTESPKFGKSPSFLFDAAYYLLDNPELVPTITMESASNHYLNVGAAQGKSPNIWFDPDYYANRWDDLKSMKLDDSTLFMHYNLYGVWEGRSAGPMFDHYDGSRYLADNPDVGAYVDAYAADFLGSRTNGAIAHYVIYGADEGRVAYDTSGNQIESAVLIGVVTL